MTEWENDPRASKKAKELGRHQGTCGKGPCPLQQTPGVGGTQEVERDEFKEWARQILKAQTLQDFILKAVESHW
jgi:hypothetical protein